MKKDLLVLMLATGMLASIFQTTNAFAQPPKKPVDSSSQDPSDGASTDSSGSSCSTSAGQECRPVFDNFYTVDETAHLVSSQTSTLNPFDSTKNLFSEVSSLTNELRTQLISLLQFVHHNENYGDVSEPYNRSKHFGTWVHDKSDGTCYNTRAKVLIRDSKDTVGVNSGGCTVVSGRWDEPYANTEVTEATQIQIDHFVPLKNAYTSGASRWDYAKRCLYANFMGNDFHLISASAHENMAKGDKSPLDYMPPNTAYRCQYLEQWLKVKMIWELGLTPPEKEAVEQLVQDNRCNLKKFQYSARDLQTQRTFIANHMDLCN